MKKISAIAAPALAGVVREGTVAAAIGEIKNCLYDGADMIDLHLSCLENQSLAALKQIIGSSSLPVLALNYNQALDKSALGLTEEARVESLLTALEAGAAGVDLQGYTFHPLSKSGFCGEDKYSFTKGGPKEVVTDPAVIRMQMDLIDRVHSMGGEVLLSCHPGIPMNTQQVVELARYLEDRGPDIIKIVTKAVTEEDRDEAIRTMLALKREIKTPVAYHANGKAGMLSRIINPMLGSQIAFCVDHYNAYATFEQIDLRAARVIADNVSRISGSV